MSPLESWLLILASGVVCFSAAAAWTAWVERPRYKRGARS